MFVDQNQTPAYTQPPQAPPAYMNNPYDNVYGYEMATYTPYEHPSWPTYSSYSSAPIRHAPTIPAIQAHDDMDRAEVYSRVPSSASLDSPRSLPAYDLEPELLKDDASTIVDVDTTAVEKKKKKKKKNKKKKSEKNKIVENPDYHTNVPDDDECVIEPIDMEPISAAELAYFD